ncbi:MAG: hypothetical protein VCG02_19635, partial [Verrucomicrobiota bacterium]
MLLCPAALFAGPPAIDTFYTPLPEDQGLTMLRSIFTQSGCSSGSPEPTNPVTTYISITVLRDGTLIYYDHVEDGFESVIHMPTNGTTEVWGNGIFADGAPPGCLTDACDVLSAGSTIILRNDIDTTNMGLIDYDGGDKIAATDIISMTRAEWAAGSATLLAGALEMYPVDKWGTFYEIPVGEDQFGNSNNPYEYTGLAVMAQAAGTSVDIDFDGDGTPEVSIVLDEGESHLVDGGLQVGATVSSSRPVQVSLLTGDRCSRYESRFFTLFPKSQWSTAYLNPVGTPPADDPTIVTLYNPDSSNLVVTVDVTGGGSSTVNVPPGGTGTYTMPNLSGAKFSGPWPFYAVAAVDAENGGGQTHDWGFALVPESGLSQQTLIGLGLGEDPDTSTGANVSPVWITTELICGVPPVDGKIRVYVDYDNDGNDAGNTNNVDPRFNLQYDVFFDLDPLEALRIYDPDGDQTGMYVWISDPDDADQECAVLATAWGQDPNTAPGGSPAIDVGTAVPNIAALSAHKTSVVSLDANGDGLPNLGDQVTYSI